MRWSYYFVFHFSSRWNISLLTVWSCWWVQLWTMCAKVVLGALRPGNRATMFLRGALPKTTLSPRDSTASHFFGSVQFVGLWSSSDYNNFGTFIHMASILTTRFGTALRQRTIYYGAKQTESMTRFARTPVSSSSNSNLISSAVRPNWEAAGFSTASGTLVVWLRIVPQIKEGRCTGWENRTSIRSRGNNHHNYNTKTSFERCEASFYSGTNLRKQHHQEWFDFFHI